MAEDAPLLDIEIPKGVVHGTFFSTTANTICTMVGGGILALPIATYHASVVLSGIIVVISITLCLASVYALVCCCDAIDCYTYQELVVAACAGRVPSKAASNFTELLVFFSNLASMTIYMRIISDSVPPVVEQLFGVSSHDVWTSRLFWVAVASCFFLGVCVLRTLRELLVITVLGVVAMMYISAVIIIEFFELRNPTAISEVKVLSIGRGIIPAFSIITGALMYQMNVPVLYKELGPARCRNSMVGTAACSYGIVGVLYLAVGLLGYFTFGDQIASAEAGGNIMENYSKDNVKMMIGRIMMFTHVMCAAPIYISVARRSFCVVFFATDDPSLKQRVGVAFFIIGVAATFSLLIPGIRYGCEFCGAFFGISVAITIPALLYIALFAEVQESNTAMGRSGAWAAGRKVKFLAAAVVLFGMAATMSSVVITAASL